MAVTRFDDLVESQMREIVRRSNEELGVDHLHLGTARHVANLVTIDPVFFQCVDHPKVLPYIEAVMGPHLILGSLNARIVRPGDGDQQLHGDVADSLQRYAPDPPVMMNTIWPLDDYTTDNGATRVVPGSHQSRLHDPPEGFTPRFQHQLEMPAGSVGIIHGQTWHAGGENRTDRDRHAMFGHYRVGDWMRFQCDPHDGFDPAWWDLLTPRQRSLLRMWDEVGGRHGADFYER